MRTRTIARLRHGLFCAGLTFVMSACSNPWAEYAPTRETVLSSGWLYGETTTPSSPKLARAVYCYKTIGVADCHDEPIEDSGNRLVGFERPLTDQRGGHDHER